MWRNQNSSLKVFFSDKIWKSSLKTVTKIWHLLWRNWNSSLKVLVLICRFSFLDETLTFFSHPLSLHRSLSLSLSIFAVHCCCRRAPFAAAVELTLRRRCQDPLVSMLQKASWLVVVGWFHLLRETGKVLSIAHSSVSLFYQP